MRFVLIDRILDVQPGDSLVAVKNLSLAEEYLGDHFPGFPVMPGVLMLEALTQAGAWLIRDMEDFAHSIIVLKQAKTIKYGSFVEPGRQLQLRVDLMAHDDREAAFKGVGVIDGQEMVKGRFTLTRYNLTRSRSRLHETDARDRRRPPRPLRDAPQGLGRRPCDDPDAPGARRSKLKRLKANEPARFDVLPTDPWVANSLIARSPITGAQA